MDRCKRDAAFVGLVTALVLGAPLAVLPRASWPSTFHDDAFYYAQIARNVATGRGVTFDGLHATSGVHPAWMLVEAFLFRVVPGSTAPLGVIAAIEAALAGLAAAIVFLILRRSFDRAAAAAGALALLAFPGASTILRSGMEGALALACLSAAVASATRPDRRPWTTGLLLAAAGAARLEAFVATPVVWGLLRRQGSPGGSTIGVLVPPVGALAAIVACCRVLTATWLPISGAVKAALVAEVNPAHRAMALLDLPLPGQDVAVRLLHLGSVGRAAVTLGLGASYAAVLWPARRTLLRNRAVPAMLVVAALWIGADKLVVSAIEPWNRVPIVLATALVAGAVLQARGARAACVLFLLVGVARVGWQVARTSDAEASYAPQRVAAARWLAMHLPPDARVGSWNAGMLGFFSERTVVCLDGLVNDRRYLDDVIRGKDLEGYLATERIGWLADQACGDPDPLPYLQRTGSERLAPRLRLEAFEHAPGADRCPGFAIWSISAPEAAR